MEGVVREGGPFPFMAPKKWAGPAVAAGAETLSTYVSLKRGRRTVASAKGNGVGNDA